MSRKQDPCVVCFNKIDYVSIGECGHKVCCATCTFRLRQLHCDEKCVVCKTKLALVFITLPGDRKTFAELMQNATCVQDEATTIRFIVPDTLQFKLEIDTMRLMQCCAETFTSKQALEKHMETKHRTKLCQLCVDNRGLFFQEHPRFTTAQLAQHIKQEHPTCKFCHNKAFYNNDAIYKHLNEKHEQCHVCSKLAAASTQAAVQQQVDYFKDYPALEQHFRTKHFLCEEPSCLRVHFVNVFSTEVEWRNHERQVHGKQSKQPLRFEFAYKDSSPAAGVEEEEEEVRHQVPLQASDFPPLLGARTTGVAVSTGAAFRPAKASAAIRSGNNKTDDFPELRKASSKPSKSSATTFRRPVTAPPVVQSHADFPSLSSVTVASLPRVSTPPPPAPPQLLVKKTEEDFPALQRPSSRNSNNGRLTRDQVRELAFAPKAPKSTTATATTGVVLMGKKKQAEEDTKKLTADQKRKQKERKELLDLAFAK